MCTQLYSSPSPSATGAVRLRAGPQLADAALEKIFSLFKANMKEMYRASSWGWHPAKKKAEFKESGMIHLILPPKVGMVPRKRESGGWTVESKAKKELSQYFVYFQWDAAQIVTSCFGSFMFYFCAQEGLGHAAASLCEKMMIDH